MNRKSKVKMGRVGSLNKKYLRAEQQLSLALRNTLLAEMQVFETVVSQLSPEEQRGWWKRLVNGLRKIDPMLVSPGLDDAIAAIESTPHGSTKLAPTSRSVRKRMRSQGVV